MRLVKDDINTEPLPNNQDIATILQVVEPGKDEAYPRTEEDENAVLMRSAVLSGNMRFLDRLLDEPNTDINRLYFGESLLMLAIKRGDLRMCRFLLRNRCNPNHCKWVFRLAPADPLQQPVLQRNRRPTSQYARVNSAYRTNKTNTTKSLPVIEFYSYSTRQMAFDVKLHRVVRMIDAINQARCTQFQRAFRVRSCLTRCKALRRKIQMDTEDRPQSLQSVVHEQREKRGRFGNGSSHVNTRNRSRSRSSSEDDEIPLEMAPIRSKQGMFSSQVSLPDYFFCEEQETTLEIPGEQNSCNVVQNTNSSKEEFTGKDHKNDIHYLSGATKAFLNKSLVSCWPIVDEICSSKFSTDNKLRSLKKSRESAASTICHTKDKHGSSFITIPPQVGSTRPITPFFVLTQPSFATESNEALCPTRVPGGSLSRRVATARPKLYQ